MEVEKEIQPLYEQLASLIEGSRQRVAQIINSEMPLLYWQTGKLI